MSVQRNLLLQIQRFSAAGLLKGAGGPRSHSQSRWPFCLRPAVNEGADAPFYRKRVERIDLQPRFPLHAEEKGGIHSTVAENSYNI